MFSTIEAWLTKSHFWRSLALKTLPAGKHLSSIVLKIWMVRGEHALQWLSHMEEWRLLSEAAKILSQRPALRFTDF